MERELFGTANDPSKQTTGINFEKYDDIPVEASGTDVPEAVIAFTSPPLDPHLLSNIELAHYKQPTPVQKYSIPIVANGRDLMACAQTGRLFHLDIFSLTTILIPVRLWKNRRFLIPYFVTSFQTGTFSFARRPKPRIRS